MTVTINIPIIYQGLVIEVPITGIINDSGSLIQNYTIQVSVPSGVSYSSASLPKGSYNSTTNTWNVGTVQNGELVEGLLYFEVVNASLAPYEFNLNINGVQNCKCVRIEGLTCYQLANCTSTGELARDAMIVAPPDSTVGPIDVTSNDQTCSNQTFLWLNTAGGKIAGTPQAATYTPGSFYGSEIAEYGLYCDGILTDTATVLLTTTYAACTTQWVLMTANSLYAGNVGESDLRCTNNGTTTWHLKNAPTAQGSISYLTTSADVEIIEWDQVTGNYQARAINSFEGVVFFDYFMRCTINGQSWDSSPGQEIISVSASFPFSSSVAVSSSNVVSSSNAASSSGIISSSAPASSSGSPSSSATSSQPPASSSALPASSSATSSIIPPSSSELIPSSNPAASSSLPFSSSVPVSSSIPVSSGTPPSSSFTFLSSSQVTSSSQPASSST